MDIPSIDDQLCRRLPPLPLVNPLPPGPFDHLPSYVCASGPTSPQDSCLVKSSCKPSESAVPTPPPASTMDVSRTEGYLVHKTFGWPDISAAEIMSLVSPTNAHRKPPLQQMHERKRNRSVAFGEFDQQRERHRIAEGNRRKNLSQLHRELDSRVHDFFLERAGWNPAKSQPRSKEHIVQGAIFLIDFMVAIVTHLLQQERHVISPQLSGKLRSYLGSIHRQQLLYQDQTDSMQRATEDEHLFAPRK